MGFLSRIVNKIKGVDATDGSHSIDRSSVLSATDTQAINPNQVGEWKSIRSVPVSSTPRYFTKAEADALWELRKQTTEGARQAKRAYKHLGKIEGNDASVHKVQRQYMGRVADAEFTKIQANAKTARHLHALRGKYAQLGTGLQNAETKADARVEAAKARIRRELNG